MAKANGVKWYGHVLRREDENILKKAMMMEVNGQSKRRRPKMTWKRQVEESVKRVGLEDRRSCRLNEMEGRSESDRGGDEVYSATFGNEEKTKLKPN